MCTINLLIVNVPIEELTHYTLFANNVISTVYLSNQSIAFEFNYFENRMKIFSRRIFHMCFFILYLMLCVLNKIALVMSYARMLYNF